MNAKLKKLILLALLLTLTSLASCKKSITTTRSIGSEYTAGSCLIGRWPSSSLPLNLKMSSDFTGDYNNSNLVAGLNPLEQMAKVWNNAVSPLVLITEHFPAAGTTGYASTNSFSDSEIGIYKSFTWFNNVSSSALAITQFYGSVQESAGLGRYISLTHGDIIVNYRDYGSRLTMTNAFGFEFDLPTIVLHEMGHLLGLCHEINHPSIMAPYYVTTQRSLQAYDSDLIKDIYVDGVISGISVNNNTNALTSPVGSHVSGVIELHADGKCVHYLNGKKMFEHQVDIRKKH